MDGITQKTKKGASRKSVAQGNDLHLKVVEFCIKNVEFCI